jgi:hypothetical protein
MGFPPPISAQSSRPAYGLTGAPGQSEDDTTHLYTSTEIPAAPGVDESATAPPWLTQPTTDTSPQAAHPLFLEDAPHRTEFRVAEPEKAASSGEASGKDGRDVQGDGGAGDDSGSDGKATGQPEAAKSTGELEAQSARPRAVVVLEELGQAGLPFTVVKEVTLANGDKVLQPVRVQQGPAVHVCSAFVFSSVAILLCLNFNSTQEWRE